MAYKDLEKQKAAKRRWQDKNREKTLEYGRKWRRKNSEKLREDFRRWSYKNNFGITVAQYEEALARQHGVCALCGQPPKGKHLAIDHDHASNRNRGIVCDPCNRHYIGANTVETAKRVLKYLETDFETQLWTPKEGRS